MSKMKVLIVAAEGMPFVKTGGLADVMGILPKELYKLGLNVAVMLPKHHAVKEKYQNQLELVASMYVKMGWRNQYIGLEKLTMDGIEYFFIDNEYYFGGSVYKGGEAEAEQYMYFCRAVLEVLPFVGFIPDVIHVNDWHTAMIPMLLKMQYTDRAQGDIKTVFTIHNLQYQGQMSFGLLADMLGIATEYYVSDYIEAYGQANMMKAALVFADKITTVSPTYAKEILDSFYGRGMEGVLNMRRDDLVGIINGIDTDEFNPLTDKLISYNYSEDSISGKFKNKVALIEEMHLTVESGTPIIGMVTRMTEQKGLDLVLAVLEEALQEDVAFVILGSGDRRYEEYFEYISGKYAGKANAYIGYSEALAHKIYAGIDMLLMPSLFEPCGLSQMIAQAYGTLPIVRETGGLVDTVQSYNAFTGEGNGFSFSNYNAHDMLNVMRLALDVYKKTEVWPGLVKNALLLDNSFKKPAIEYQKLYESLVK